jgi:hypothetical protein
MIVPLEPTAQHVVVDAQAAPERKCVVPDTCGVHVVPPFVVATIAPPLTSEPTAQQPLLEGHEIPFSCTVGETVWLDQLEPPLLVARIVPKPTAQHWVVLAQATA